MENALGHVPHRQYLERWVAEDPGIAAEWMLIPYRADDLWERLPGLPFSLRTSLRAGRMAAKTMRRVRPDGYFFHTQGLALTSMRLIASVPTLISLDATPKDFARIAAAYDAHTATGTVERIKSAWFRRVFARAAGLVTWSDWARASLVRDYGVPADKVWTVRTGIDLDTWRPRPEGLSRRARLRLLFVGGDFERKGGAVLLEAFRAGLSDLAELDIVTRQPPAAPEPSIRVHTGLTPNDPRLRRLYEGADLFVMPTAGDASPFAVIEALACGLPVIATRVGALDEMVEDGVNGCLVPAADAAAIVRMVWMLAADRERLAAMGREARASVERRYDARTNYRALVERIKSTVQTRAVRAC